MSIDSNNSDNSLPWQIRKAMPADIPFIYSSWLKSFKYGSTLGKSMRKGIFFEQYREVIDLILSDSQVVIACLKDSPEVILSYLVYESYSMNSNYIIHYAFTKESFRNMKIVNSLVEHMGEIKPIVYTHSTLMLEELLQIVDKQVTMTYNPILLYKKEVKE